MKKDTKCWSNSTGQSASMEHLDIHFPQRCCLTHSITPAPCILLRKPAHAVPSF